MPRHHQFKLVGRLVHHAGHPHFSVIFTPRDGGGWDGKLVGSPDDLKALLGAPALARLVRQAEEFFAANCQRDWIQDSVIGKASELGLSSYEISKRTGGAVSEDHVRDYLMHRKSMGSHKLQHVLRVLGLEFRPFSEKPSIEDAK